MIGHNPGSGVRYQAQSLQVQVRIPFTVLLETPYGTAARGLRGTPEPDTEYEPEAGQ